ncbi:hypothetical protein GTR02_03630 [Kineococcus sp. R8]|uniref:hypothetical protein n=1 Tax=Kineococcus siccus TaxID=2696567 RepID=UPI0014136B20|nr:hypothetical protein [Kineococcus siccus]NAZ80907.1 hypothetical protein [Kineococcus siccus]
MTWLFLILATAAASAVAGSLVTRAHPGERLPWRAPLPPSWSFMNTEPWYSTAARWATSLLGVAAGVYAGDRVGLLGLVAAVAAMAVPVTTIEAVHNRRLAREQATGTMP